MLMKFSTGCAVAQRSWSCGRAYQRRICNNNYAIACMSWRSRNGTAKMSQLAAIQLCVMSGADDLAVILTGLTLETPLFWAAGPLGLLNYAGTAAATARAILFPPDRATRCCWPDFISCDHTDAAPTESGPVRDWRNRCRIAASAVSICARFINAVQIASNNQIPVVI